MYQTLQSTGVCWRLELVIPGRDSIMLGYSSKLMEVCRKIEPNVTLRVLPDAIVFHYFRLGARGVEKREESFKKPLTNRRGHVRLSLSK